MSATLLLDPLPDLWTKVAAPAGSDGDGDGSRLPQDLRQLANVAEAVHHAMHGIAPEARDGDAIFREATARLRGDRRRELSETIPMSHRWFEKLYTRARRAYGIEPPIPDRPARALLLVAAEHSFVPVAEGACRAADWWPSSKRLDLRSAFHVVTQWGFECDPLLARLAAWSLDGGRFPLPWPPFKALYAHVLALHDPDEARSRPRADQLAVATAEALLHHYRHGGTSSDVVRRLLLTAEEIGILPPRPRFEPDPALLRRNELARLVLDLELGRAPDSESEALVELLRHELTA
jgi:hypothetical protein